MKVIVQAMVACLAATGLSGCGWFNSQFHIDPITKNAAATDAGGAFDLATGKLANDCDFNKAVTEPLCRNRLMDHLIHLSRTNCELHKSKIFGTASGWDLTFSSLTTSLGGAGAIVTGADAARGLAGAAGITSGLHSNFRENIYHNNISDAILKQIDRQRAAKLQQMMAQRAQPTEMYTPEGMLADVTEYHALCSFAAGVQGLGSTERRPLTADELRGRIRSIRQEISDNATALDRAGITAEETRNLTEANASLSRMLTHLTRQLAVVMSSDGGSPVSGDPAKPAGTSGGDPAKAPAGSSDGGTVSGGSAAPPPASAETKQ